MPHIFQVRVEPLQCPTVVVCRKEQIQIGQSQRQWQPLGHVLPRLHRLRQDGPHLFFAKGRRRRGHESQRPRRRFAVRAVLVERLVGADPVLLHAHDALQNRAAGKAHLPPQAAAVHAVGLADDEFKVKAAGIVRPRSQAVPPIFALLIVTSCSALSFLYSTNNATPKRKSTFMPSRV